MLRVHRLPELSPQPSDEHGTTQMRNHLLNVLPANELAELLPNLESVMLHSGDVITEPNERIDYAYFPEGAIFSLVSRMHDGATAEVGTIGEEGMVGLPLYLGAHSSLFLTLVQVPGTSWRLSTSAFVAAIARLPVFAALVGHFAHAYLTRVSQTAACNRLHPLKQRCAQWLLLTHDRAGGSDTFQLTHEFLSYMLGVRRAGVTEAARSLQSAGLIRYARGRVTIVDRRGLEAAACECSASVIDHLRREQPQATGARA